MAKGKAAREKKTAPRNAAAQQMYINSAGTQVQTTAPTRPSNIQESYIDAGSGKSFNTRFVPGAMMPGQQGYDPSTGGGVWAAGGGTDEDIRAWYRGDPNTAMNQAVSASGKDASAFSLDSLYGNGAQTATASTNTQQRTSLKDAKGIGQALRIAGAGGGIISNKELKTIGNQFDVGSDRVVRRLDKANDKRMSNRKATYALGSKAYNSLTGDNMFGYYGEGAIGQAVRAGLPRVNGNENDSRSLSDPLRVRKGVAVTGLTAKGDIDTRERFMGRGSFNAPMGGKGRKGKGKGMTDATTSTTATSNPIAPAVMDQPIAPQVEEQANTPMGPGGLYGGGMGSMGANKLRRAKSRIQNLGIRGQGTGLLGRGLQYGTVLNK